MRRVATLILIILILSPGMLFAGDSSANREQWGNLLIERGMKPGEQVSPAEWNQLLNNLTFLAADTGAIPDRSMSQEQWGILLERARMRMHESNAPLSVSTRSVMISGVMNPIYTGLTARAGIDDRSAVHASTEERVHNATGHEATAIKQVSLDLRDMDIVEVLKILSRQSGLSVVVGKNVTGRVTVFLNKVDFWDALRMILETRGLAYSREGSVIEVMAESDFEQVFGESFSSKRMTRVFTPAILSASTAKSMLEPLKSRVGTLHVHEANNTLAVEDGPAQIARMEKRLSEIDGLTATHVFKLNYAAVEDIMPKVNGLVSKDFGNIQSDKRSNTIVVKDNPVRIREIADIVKAFDIKNKAVLIEAKIVQITLNDSFQWGINWQGVNWTYFFSQMRDYHASGRVAQNFSLVPPETTSGLQPSARGITATVGVLEKPNFSAVINFLNTAGTTNLLSSPRVMALNNQEAKIHVGSKVAKITRTLLNVGSTTSNLVTTENVEFLDVGVKLAVTPSIGDDGTITMKVKPEVSSVENTITTSEGSSIPVIRVSEAEASLVVKDGITVVLGGLIEDAQSKTDVRVPVLGRIPILGALFRSRDSKRLKTELVIFLTPRIIPGDVVSSEAQTRFDLEPDGTEKPRKGFFRRLFGRT